MIATALSLLSKFLVFMGKWMTAMMKSWHQSIAATKLTWKQVATDLYNIIHYGMHNMLLSLR